MKKRKIVLAAILILVAAAVIAAFTVPITVGGNKGAPQPGSPDYAEPLKSSAIPPVPPKFGGEIKPNANESKAVVAADASCRRRARPTCCSS